MSGMRGTAGTRMRTAAVGCAVAGLLAGMAVPPAFAAGWPTSAAGPHRAVRPPVPTIRPASAIGRLPFRGAARRAAVREVAPAHTSWPAPVSATITVRPPAELLAPAGLTAAPGTPLLAGPAGARAGAPRVTMAVLGQRAAGAAGVRGVVLTARAAAGSRGGRVRLGISYAGFAHAAGGYFAAGLELARLPGCALTTPRRPACDRVTPLGSSVNDWPARQVSAVVTLPGAGAGRPGPAVVLAATTSTADGGGTAGTYAATSLRPSGTWSAGGSSGSFTYSYPIQVPPAAGALAPHLSLAYDSGVVDGQTADTQPQASWLGDGWTLAGGESYIEQSFTSCSDDPEGSASPKATQDECYGGPVLTLSLGGTSVPLVCPVSTFSYAGDSTCVSSADSGDVVTHHVKSGNGQGCTASTATCTKFADYWTVTGRDGTTYYFGLNRLHGWASGDPVTGSVDSAPVYSAHSGDPCYSSSGFASSACVMAYRWHLDYVTDAHGNAMAFYYAQDVNAYGEDGSTASGVLYVRDSHLARIDYGFADGGAYAATVPGQVRFTTGDRCFVAGKCDPISTYYANWQDVPYHQYFCAAGKACPSGDVSPTYWSTVTLTGISAGQNCNASGTCSSAADTWKLSPALAQQSDGTYNLWLSSVQRTGADTTAGGSAVTLPPVTFTPVQEANRVNPGTDPALYRDRLGTITTETGSVITVTYETPVACVPGNSNYPPAPSGNHQSCFPEYWGTFTPSAGADWFNKWAVKSVQVSDPAGGSPGLFTSYAYASPAWHFDDNELVQAKDRTYGQWRGYQDVKTYSGSGDPNTETETTYYQGMSDDNNTTVVNLKDSQNGLHEDLNQLSGETLETTSYDYASTTSTPPAGHSEIFSYYVSPSAMTRTRSGLPDLTANFTGVVEDWSRQAITDGSATTWRETETDTSYDSSVADALFGLPLFVFRHGDLSGTTQQQCTSYAYAPANTARNIVGLVAETETDAAACGGANPGGASAPGSGQVNALTAPASVSRPADVVSDTRIFYDDPSLAQTWPQPASPAWPQAAPGNGDVSVVRQANGWNGSAFTYQTTSAKVYDSYGRVTASYDGNGGFHMASGTGTYTPTSTAYTMSNGMTTGTTVTNPLGQAVTSSLDPLTGQPVSVTDPNHLTTTLHYDGLGRLIDVWEHGRATSTTPNWAYSYDVAASGPAMVTAKQLNDAGGQVTSVTLYDSLLRTRQTQFPTPQGGILVTDHFYDSRGWEWKTNHHWWDKSASPGNAVLTIPDSQVPDQTVTQYDGMGRPVIATSFDDSAARAVTYTAYTGDRVTTVLVNDQPATPVVDGTPTSTETDALGRTTELDSYTSAPAVTASTNPGGFPAVTVTGGSYQATTRGYDHRGRLATLTDAATGEQWTWSYNLLGQVTGTTDPNAGAISSSYDNNGNLTATTDADQHTISYTYDALNRKTGEYDGPTAASPLIASWVYDNSNNVTGVSNPVGHLTTENSYDSSGNAYTIQQDGFNSFGESVGQTVTIPPTPATAAGGGSLAGSYQLIHTYSLTTGLPLDDYYPASPGSGALPAETAGTGYCTGFDLPCTLASKLTVNGQTTDAAYEQNVTYTAFSQVAQQELGAATAPDNAYVTNTYDPNTGNLSDTQVANTAVSSTPYDDTSYAYDPAGNITSQTDARNGTQTETQCFGYDLLARLTQAWTTNGSPACSAGPSTGTGGTVGDGITGSAYWTTWAFNPLGDRTSETDHSLTGGQDTVTSYAYNGNGKGQPDTLTSTSTTSPAGNSSYTYDAAGNTLTRNVPSGNQTLTWSDNGKLATNTTSAGTTSYIYDADGNLLLTEDPGQTTLYLFGGAQQLVLSTATGAVTGTRFLPVPGGGEVVRTGAGSSYDFELADQHGTGVLTLDPTLANPSWRQFTPYGSPRGNSPPTWPDTNAFLGKPADTTTGLDIIGARQYDPGTGRFLSIDPVLNPASPQELNGYSYAADNPVASSDPSGLGPVPDGGSCPSSQPGCPGYSPPSNPTPGLPCTPFCQPGVTNPYTGGSGDSSGGNEGGGTNPGAGSYNPYNPFVDYERFFGAPAVRAVSITGQASTAAPACSPNALHTGFGLMTCTTTAPQSQGGSCSGAFFHFVCHLVDNARTEVVNHWRGLAQVGITLAGVVANGLCDGEDADPIARGLCAAAVNAGVQMLTYETTAGGIHHDRAGLEANFATGAFVGVTGAALSIVPEPLDLAPGLKTLFNMSAGTAIGLEAYNTLTPPDQRAYSDEFEAGVLGALSSLP